MTSLFVHVGQCGCTLAGPIWDECTSQSSSQVFLLDAEPKVVRSVVSNHPSLSKAQCIWDQSGRGNNFAMGYSCVQEGRESSLDGYDHLIERCLESIRKFAEKSDRRLATFFLIHGMAGGTGSGLGCRLLEEISTSDWGGNGSGSSGIEKITASILPLWSGETCLQWYNALLGLSWLQEYADASLLLQNDYILNLFSGGTPADSESRRPTAPRSSGGHSKGPCLEQINNYLSTLFCHLLNPQAEMHVYRPPGFITNSSVFRMSPLSTENFAMQEWSSNFAPIPSCKFVQCGWTATRPIVELCKRSKKSGNQTGSGVQKTSSTVDPNTTYVEKKLNDVLDSFKKCHPACHFPNRTTLEEYYKRRLPPLCGNHQCTLIQCGGPATSSAQKNKAVIAPIPTATGGSKKLVPTTLKLKQQQQKQDEDNAFVIGDGPGADSFERLQLVSKKAEIIMENQMEKLLAYPMHDLSYSKVANINIRSTTSPLAHLVNTQPVVWNIFF
eukprot:GHVL01031788.1.p1 GENE.GHVL01031788.1~~GHVL01031788.1.p1  ORF type:complete len:498 (+),score=96.81 GHVL01031788.1:24-1517(+)